MIPNTSTLALCFALVLSSIHATAQTSNRQRLSFEPKTIAELGLSLSTQLTPDNVSSSQGVGAMTSLGIDMLVLRILSLSVSLPFASWTNLGREALPRTVAAAGDPNIAIGLTFRAKDWKLGLDAHYSYPLGIWDPYAFDTLKIMSGTGNHRLGGGLSATRFIDPLVLTFQVSGDTNLPRSELGGISSRPLTISLAGSATEALNSRVALGLNLRHVLFWPKIAEGVPDTEGFSYSLTGGLVFALSEDPLSFSLELSKQLQDASLPASIAFSLTYAFRIKERPHE